MEPSRSKDYGGLSLADLPPAGIIASDPQVSKEVAGVLAFLGLRSEILPADAVAARLSDDQRFSALMLCGSAVTSRILKALDELERGPPVVAIDTELSIAGSYERLHARLLGRIERPLRHVHLVPLLERILAWRPPERNPELFRSLVGQSAPIQRIRDMIARVAPSDSTVLILGETGTGKEVVARHIHYHSQRRAGPFVAVNCGAIPPDLLESELFGHEKGAFTGALAARKGRFELAEGGTLFLDEIGDMSLAMQVKLLRVLQERQFERLGSGKSQRANVRIVCATHRDLEKMVTANEFRGDLYYRINVFPVEMPPLRARCEDLPLLTVELVSRLAAEGRGTVSFTTRALAAMARYDWPGNVRELANMIERMLILNPSGSVTVRDLPPHIGALADPDDGPEEVLRDMAPAPISREPEREDPEGDLAGAVHTGARAPAAMNGFSLGRGESLKDHLENIEEQIIRRALADSAGTVVDAAKALGMRRTTLVEKLRKFDIDRREFMPDS
ncbi:sigma-54-dependent Fis family transcriptional regulator [Thioalkalivibrio sp. XN279]|uniref:sigma-54 interaction domain-containing protein n=1 Tax=Thioalkalivibrio sp. XN279 TaxID=2714953 RepID=UPI001409F0ED|nr:sigma-54 dependent transcriptional regulator [Thioalkalivibrio sp. XN279]NHA13371.1 sigma-54-dependent Fis family transcriptional regulator [Thioalkalivibrio sp. XN279]